MKSQATDGKIPRGLLLGGTKAITEFKLARALDRVNEKNPLGVLEKKRSIKLQEEQQQTAKN